MRRWTVGPVFSQEQRSIRCSILPAAYAFMMDRYERELCIGVLKKLLRRRKRED